MAVRVRRSPIRRSTSAARRSRPGVIEVARPGAVGGAVERQAAKLDARPREFGGEVARGAPLPAVVAADGVDGEFDRSELDAFAQPEVSARDDHRIAAAFEGEAQHIEQMIGKGETRKFERELFLMDGGAQLAIGALEAIAFAAGQNGLEFGREMIQLRLDAADGDAERFGRIGMRDRPGAGASGGAFEAEKGAELGLGGELGGVGLELGGAAQRVRARRTRSATRATRPRRPRCRDRARG